MALKKIFLNVILIFLLLFSFRLPMLFNSTILAFFISIPIILKSKDLLLFYHLFISRYMFRIFIVFILVIITSLLPAIFHLTYDITILNKFIGSGATIAISIFIFATMFNDLKDKNTIIKYFVFVFLLQSIIQIFGLVNPTFLSFIQTFQDPNAREVAEFYQGMRGLALSSDIFFGLSGAYGLIYLLYTAYLIDKENTTYLDFFIFLFLIIGSFFVGKTALIGLIISFLYLLFSKIRIRNKIKIVIISFFTIVISSFILYSMLSDGLQDIITEQLLPQAFDIFYNYIDTGNYNNYSTTRLTEMLAVPISLENYLIGSGYYTVDGHYYLHTDSGYIRQILYGGILYMLIILIYQKVFLLDLYWLSFENKKEKYYFKLLNNCILLYLLILHIKGEIIGTNKMILVILVFYALSMLKFKKKQRN